MAVRMPAEVYELFDFVQSNVSINATDQTVARADPDRVYLRIFLSSVPALSNTLKLGPLRRPTGFAGMTLNNLGEGVDLNHVLHGVLTQIEWHAFGNNGGSLEVWESFLRRPPVDEKERRIVEDALRSANGGGVVRTVNPPGWPQPQPAGVDRFLRPDQPLHPEF